LILPDIAVKAETIALSYINQKNIDLKYYNLSLIYFDLLERYNCELFFHEFKRNNKILGHTLSDNLGTTIMINSDLHGGRRLFTMAHELAHAIYHVNNTFESEMTLKGNNKNAIETEANQFAAHLMLPTKVILAHIKSYHTLSIIQNRTRASYECLQYHLINILNYSKFFKYDDILTMYDEYKECRTSIDVSKSELYKAYCILFDRLYLNNQRFKIIPKETISSFITLPIDLKLYI